MAITYTPTTNFGLKDSLPTNDPAKVIKGAEFSTEFTAIQTAFGQAAPLASPTFTGTVTISSVDINGGTIDGVTIGGSSAGAASFTTLTASGDVNFDSGTFFVDASADAVGIGTTSPSSYPVASNFVVDTGTNGGITIKSGTSNYGGVFFADGTTGNEQYRGFIQYNHNYVGSTDSLLFGTSGAERMRIDASGNVGIGTDSPQGILEVVDTNPVLQIRDSQTSAVSATATLRMGESGLSGIENYWDIKVNGSDGALQFIDNWSGGSGTGTRMVIDDSGNVGIGTTTPACGLDVSNGGNGAVGEQMRITSSTANAKLAFVNTGGNGAITQSSGAMIFQTNTANTERMRIDASGNALIGTPAVTGSLSNTKRVTGGIFSTNNGTTSVPNATWTTLTAIPTGDAIYLVTAYLPNSGDPAGYNAVSIVTTSLTGTNLVDIKNANQVALRMSGSNLQVNHGQGTTQPINWSILRLA